MPLVYDDGSPIVLTASNGTPIRARLYAYNSAGTSLRTADIVLTPSTGALVTSVTGSSAPLHVSQALLIDGVSYDVQVVSHFAGQPDELTAAVLATYTAPATPTVGALRYTPPTMTNPIIINVPTTGGSYDYLAQLDRDIILNLPSSPVTGSVECKGGRNWRVIGGHFSSNRWLKNISGERAACMDINRWTGTFHIEGVVFDPFNQGLSFDPTVNVDTLPAHYHDNITSWSGSATSILVVQNCWGRVAHMHDPESANKGDLLQTYRGPSAVRVHRYTGRSNGQGMFMWSTNLSGYPTFQEHQFKDINLIRQAAPNNGGGAMYGLWPETIPVTVENCYVQKAAGSNTGEASGSGADLWTRSTSPRPEGDIVHPSTIGLGYPQPGETGHPGYVA